MSSHPEKPQQRRNEAVGALDPLHTTDLLLSTARAEVASMKEEAAQKDAPLQERDQQLEEAAQQLEHARSEILSLKAEAARTEALLEGSQGEIAYLVQQVRAGCMCCSMHVVDHKHAARVDD
jgi:chromosome segregation ATPase